MKNILFLFCLSVLSLGTSCVEQRPTSIERDKKLPNDYMFMQRAYPSGRIDRQAHKTAAIWAQTNKTRAAADAPWEAIGPVNIGGRISDIEFTSSHIYVGAASGGLFVSADDGVTWTPTFDDQATLSIGDIAVAPSDNNIVYVGTGEPNAGGGSLAYDGNGVYRSTDNGFTWENIGLPDTGSIGKIVVHPSDPNTLYVGAMGPLFVNNDQGGVYKSTDAGATWEQVLFISNITGIIDMCIHPTNPDIIYAAAWERERTVDDRDYGGPTSGIYKTEDGGTTWIELTNGLPTDGNLKGRISIDIAVSNPNTLWASYTDATGNLQGVYQTIDGGNSWITKTIAGIQNVGFHWWFGGLFVDPTDENTVFHVGFDMDKTTDGATSWQPTFNNVHVDQHALAFNPANAQDILLGNDGGLYRSVDGGTTWTKDETLPITQFYRIFIDPSDENRWYGGTQDNSTMRTITGSTDDWVIINGGDGFQPLVNKDDNTIIYALSQRGNLRRSTNDAASFQTILNGIDPNDRNNWDTPIAFDPQDNSMIYYGTQRLYRSTNNGGNWNAISDDLTGGAGNGINTFGTLTSISVSAFDSDLIYTGSDDGNVYRTQDGGNTWENLSSTLPDRWVTAVLADPINEDTVYVTYSGYRFGENIGHVYKSTDRGTTWTDITGVLPDIPVNDVLLVDLGQLYIATDIGVFISENEDGTDWTLMNDGIPPVVVTDLHAQGEYLYAGTYGRSMFRSTVNTLNTEEFEIASNPLILFPNPSENWVYWSSNISDNSASVTVFDLKGAVVIPQKNLLKNTPLDVSHLEEGLYLVQVEISGTTLSRKLIKK